MLKKLSEFLSTYASLEHILTMLLVLNRPNQLTINPCPGFYCPKQCGKEQACPKGTYNVNEGAPSIDSCLPCEENKYNPFEGSTKCYLCGADAYTLG